jgi:hypothetical protein
LSERDLENNPYINGANYFEGYEKSIEEIKDNPKLQEMDKLIYEVFKINPAGAKLLELFLKQFVMPSLYPISAEDYSTRIAYYEGFKDAFRRIEATIKYVDELRMEGVNTNA